MTYSVKISTVEADGKVDFAKVEICENNPEKALTSFWEKRRTQSIKGFKKPMPKSAKVEEIRDISEFY